MPWGDSPVIEGTREEAPDLLDRRVAILGPTIVGVQPKGARKRHCPLYGRLTVSRGLSRGRVSDGTRDRDGHHRDLVGSSRCFLH